jgi:hypothetical protein
VTARVLPGCLELENECPRYRRSLQLRLGRCLLAGTVAGRPSFFAAAADHTSPSLFAGLPDPEEARGRFLAARWSRSQG